MTQPTSCVEAYGRVLQQECPALHQTLSVEQGRKVVKWKKFGLGFPGAGSQKVSSTHCKVTPTKQTAAVFLVFCSMQTLGVSELSLETGAFSIRNLLQL